MYTLRTIYIDGRPTTNQYLGDYYHTITRSDKGFDQYFEDYNGEPYEPPKETDEDWCPRGHVMGFIGTHDISNSAVIYDNAYYYIVGPDGKTFENLTHRFFKE